MSVYVPWGKNSVRGPDFGNGSFALPVLLVPEIKGKSSAQFNS